MKIFVSHPSNMDYQRLLYQPLKSSILYQHHKFVLPHDKNFDGFHSKLSIQQADLIIAEVSLPSTGVGIELGWAENALKPILLLQKKGVKPSNALGFIEAEVLEYSDSENLITKLEGGLAKYDN